jgi:aminoglycoside phosphotransferase (APT) family kinase protein
MPEAGEMAQFAELARRLEPQAKLVRACSLQGGISAQMTALALLLPDGRSRKLIVRRPSAWALRQNPQAAAAEFRILQLAQATGVTTPAPYTFDQSREILSEPYLVMEYIDGRPQCTPDDATDFVAQMAAQLARIHLVKAGEQDLSFLPQQAPGLAAMLQEWPEKLDYSLEEGRIRATLAAVWPLPRVNDPVLLHGDFWPGNLLWRDGRLVAVVDWEDAQLGDPLSDVANSRLDLLMLLGSEAMDEFTQQYRALAAIDFTNLPYWDLLAALRPAFRMAEWAAVWPELGRADITEATMRAAHRLFVSRAYEQLNITD